MEVDLGDDMREVEGLVEEVKASQYGMWEVSGLCAEVVMEEGGVQEEGRYHGGSPLLLTHLPRLLLVDPSPEHPIRTTVPHLRTLIFEVLPLREQLQAYLPALAQLLQGNYFLGAEYSVIDSIMLGLVNDISVEANPRMVEWLERCRGRAGYHRVLASRRSVENSRRSTCSLLPHELLQVVLAHVETHDVLSLQLVSRVWRKSSTAMLQTRLPVVSRLLPFELVHDGWRIRVCRTHLRVVGLGNPALTACGNISTSARLMSWLERLMNPVSVGEPTSPPWAPGGDKRKLDVELRGPVEVSPVRMPPLQKFSIELQDCSSEQRDATLAFRNWLLVVEELPSAQDNSLGGLSLYTAESNGISSRDSSPLIDAA